MRVVDFEDIVNKVADLCIEVNTSLPHDVVSKMYQAVDAETSQLARQVLCILLDNIKIARVRHAPICQDTGIAVFFVELGGDVKIVGGILEDAINEGVRRGYEGIFEEISGLMPTWGGKHE
jgi:fumarate hydratase subunit alpha